MATNRKTAVRLTSNGLRAVVNRFDLESHDGRAQRGMVNAIVASRKVDLEPALAKLTQKRLKELCRKLDIDNSWREKSALVAHLRGNEPAAALNGHMNGRSTERRMAENRGPVERHAGCTLPPDIIGRTVRGMELELGADDALVHELVHLQHRATIMTTCPRSGYSPTTDDDGFEPSASNANGS